MKFLYNVALIVLASDLEQSSDLADRNARINSYDDFTRFFSIPLTNDGDTITHYGCHTAMRTSMYNKLNSLKHTLGSGWWAVTSIGGEKTGETFETLCSSLGLYTFSDPYLITGSVIIEEGQLIDVFGEPV